MNDSLGGASPLHTLVEEKYQIPVRVDHLEESLGQMIIEDTSAVKKGNAR
jgi:hypothetical protein